MNDFSAHLLSYGATTNPTSKKLSAHSNQKNLMCKSHIEEDSRSANSIFTPKNATDTSKIESTPHISFNKKPPMIKSSQKGENRVKSPNLK